MDIKYFVRTTGERKLDDSFKQIEYELLIDSDHKPIESFIAQLKYISNFNAVLLEDDVILCRDFKNRIEAAIESHRTDIINFYTSPLQYFTTQYSMKFSYNQCTYYPKGIADKIANKMIELYNPELKVGYDVLEFGALNKLKLPHLKYRPCLVQHNDKKSLITESNESRITPYFIDYLDDLNIEYNSKNCILSINKLLECRNKHLDINLLKK